MTKQNLNRRQARWAAELAEFDFLLHYKKGSTMGQSDALSRRPDLKGETEAVLKAAAEDMKRYYDAWHRPEEFKPGDHVWLNAKDLITERPSKKLDHKRLGPFKIIRKVGELAYELKLPPSFKIHPVISASQLEHAKPDEWQRPRPRVTLEVRDPLAYTGAIVNSAENRRSLFKISTREMNQIHFHSYPEIKRSKLNKDIRL